MKDHDLAIMGQVQAEMAMLQIDLEVELFSTCRDLVCSQAIEIDQQVREFHFRHGLNRDQS
jgi:hypothetical protein